MPKYISRTPIGYAQAWISLNPCPLDEDGAPCINDWVWKAALVCGKQYRVPDEQLYYLIESKMNRRQKGNEIARAIQKAKNTTLSFLRPSAPKPEFSLELLKAQAAQIPIEITDEWLRDRSPGDILWTDGAGYLDSIFQPGEMVTVVHPYKAARGTGFVYHIGDPDDAEELHRYAKDNKDGVWYTSNPVNGIPTEEKDGRPGSIRCEQNLTSFRHLVVESDHAKEHRGLWLKVLVQLRLPIKAIYESGSSPPSIHALVDIGAKSKDEFEAIKDRIEAGLVPLGADPSVMSALRLTRLPFTVRGDNGREQALLYLDGNAAGHQINL